MRILTIALLNLTLVACEHPSKRKQRKSSHSHHTVQAFTPSGEDLDGSGASEYETVSSEYTYNNDAYFDDGTTIPVEVEGGVWHIWVEINGTPERFIFDTGAGIISISRTMARRLVENGTLREEDILGQQQFSDATGRTSIGTVINLRSVTIGDRTLYNVQASITNTDDAPLLLGQTALGQFGKIEIDNVGKRIILRRF